MGKALWSGSLVLLCMVAPAPADERAEAVAPTLLVIRGAQVVGRPVVPVSIDVDLRELPPPPEWQPGDPIKDIPKRAYPPQVTPPAIVDPIPDPLLDLQTAEPNTRDFDMPLVNMDAQLFTGPSPPDTVGDVGANHYIHAVNTSGGSSIRIYDKSIPVPNVLTTFVLDTLPGIPAPCNAGLGDPVILYDALADRWFLSEFSNSGNRICVYVSKTSDPVTGGWWHYAHQAPAFPDYPKYAVWPDAYYVTTNEGSGGPAAYAMDRVNMLNGAVARPTQRFVGTNLPGFGFEALTPADPDGSTHPPAGAPGIFMRHRDDESHPPTTNPAGDFLDMWEFHVDFNTPANSTFTQLPSIVTSEFSSEMCGLTAFACFPQPGTGTTLDPIREVVMWRLAYRNFSTHETLVGNLVTDADGEPDNPPTNTERGGIRWFELRKVAAAWTLFQEGTHSPDPNPRWMGGIAMDADGGIAVGYNIVNNVPAIFPSLRYAGRLASDPPGTLRAEVNLVDGTASSSTNRYGDYAAMSVDPSDDCTFWFTGEYNPSSQWRTRLGAFKFDSCGNAVPANNATFDAGLQAPSCLATGRSCDSAALLVGRDTITGGPEPNQPNTIHDSCADGTSGTFHMSESIDRIRVGTTDGTQMSPGKTVRVDVTVWGRAFGPSSTVDTLDLYFTGDANSPVWTHIVTTTSRTSGQHLLSGTYTLPTGGLQAVRARFRYQGTQAACGAGPFDDHDDLAFVVQ